MTDRPEGNGKMTAENRTGHPLRTAAVAVVVGILLALVVFPGFLAAGLSWGKSPIVELCVSGDGEPLVWIVCRIHLERPLEAIFFSANKLMRISPAMRVFYTWQYHLAGGKDTPLVIVRDL